MRQMDYHAQPADAVQDLMRARKLGASIFVCTALAFFLLHGLFGYVRRHEDQRRPPLPAKVESAPTDTQGHP